MLKSLFIICLWIVLLGFISCNQESGSSQNQHKDKPSRQQDISAITAVSKARAAAFSKGDAAGIAIHFTDDAMLMAPDKPAMQGREAVQSYYQSIFDEYVPGLNSYYDEVEVSGDLAYGRGFAEVVLTPRQGGQTLRSTAKYINILKRQADGSWKTTHDIWNSNERVISNE